MIVVKLFCCLPDEYTEHLFILPFFLTQSAASRVCLLSPALCFICFMFFDCQCVIVSLISAVHLFLWNVPFGESLLCASVLLEGLIAEIQGQLFW